MPEPLKISNFINGQYVPPLSNQWIDNVNPADGQVVGQTADSSPADVEHAVQAAAAAFDAWSETTLESRSAILMRIGD